MLTNARYAMQEGNERREVFRALTKSSLKGAVLWTATASWRSHHFISFHFTSTQPISLSKNKNINLIQSEV